MGTGIAVEEERRIDGHLDQINRLRKIHSVGKRFDCLVNGLARVALVDGNGGLTRGECLKF